jgi:hypothetical protein
MIYGQYKQDKAVESQQKQTLVQLSIEEISNETLLINVRGAAGWPLLSSPPRAIERTEPGIIDRLQNNYQNHKAFYQKVAANSAIAVPAGILAGTGIK